MIRANPRIRQPWVRNGAGGPADLCGNACCQEPPPGGPTAQMIFQEIGLRAARARSKAFALKLGGDIAESVGETGADGCHSENGGNGDQRGD